MKIQSSWPKVLSTLAAFAITATHLGAATKAANPNSTAFGQSLAEWIRDAIASQIATINQIPLAGLEPAKNNVLFLPIPNSDTWEDWEGKSIGIGEMNLTLAPGVKSVLPILIWYGETYQDHNNVVGGGYPDDQPWPKSEFLPPKGEAVIILDGVPLVDASNQADFYIGPINFKETLWYPAATGYGSTGAIWCEGLGLVLPPLSPGQHTLTLYSWDYWMGMVNGDAGMGWFNTWHITVAPPGRK